MDKDEALKFINSLKEGDFLVVEKQEHELGFITRTKTMIICYEGHFVKDGFGEGWHSARAKFMVNMGGNFRVDVRFGIEIPRNDLRKPTPAEMFKLIDEVRKAGCVYNKKTKQLIKIKL